MFYACVERFDVIGGRGNILGCDEEVNKAPNVSGIDNLHHNLQGRMAAPRQLVDRGRRVAALLVKINCNQVCRQVVQVLHTDTGEREIISHDS
jgi:hypothetical protein